LHLLTLCTDFLNLVLAEHGHVADIDLTGAHLKIRWTANDRVHLLVLPKTSSDCRADANARALVKRLLREEESA
jgi:hypothetical protein